MRHELRNIPMEKVLRLLRSENPWWAPPHRIGSRHEEMRPRAYLAPLLELMNAAAGRRSVVLMGPRRVGKTVLIRHLIRALLERGAAPTRLHAISVDHPLYLGLGIEELADAAAQASGTSLGAGTYLFLDEIQYMRNWEVHLKTFVDSHPDVAVLVSGSAAAALQWKSRESGAGRFTDFVLPPLTFAEFCTIVRGSEPMLPGSQDVDELNRLFVEYVNYGGFPELATDQVVRSDPARFVKNDVIDRVLLRDLPALYGIGDVQELYRVFTVLAHNTAKEVSLEGISRTSGIAKNTLKRYLEYLESAFLIRRVRRIDQNARRMKREVSFKVYLTNPSMWTALFGPADPDSPEFGFLAETAVFAQMFHLPHADSLRYARWGDAEVDLVLATMDGKPTGAAEIKWSDRAAESDQETRTIVRFCRPNGVSIAVVTTRSSWRAFETDGVAVFVVPTSWYALQCGCAAADIRSRLAGTPLTPSA